VAVVAKPDKTVYAIVMNFLAPFALLFGLLAGPIILMYMLRLRRQEVVVSSTLLWQKLIRDREANAPWQKLRRNILLILQLIILSLLVLALARPFIPVPSVVNSSVVVLLDGSASMQATDTAEGQGNHPTRFVAAQEEVNDLIRSLNAGNQMTIIQVGRTPQVLASATSDKRELYDVVETATPENSTADWAAAFALASGAAQGFRSARVVIVSDGGLPDDLPPLPADSVYIPVGVSGENLAISALATRNSESGVVLFASVTNEGTIPQTAVLSVGVDGALFDAREVFIDGGETANFTWDLDDQTSVIVAQLSGAQFDHLAADDLAYAVHEGGVSNRTLIVTNGNIFVEQVFGVLPGIEAFKAEPSVDVNDPASNDFDLYVFDGVSLPDPLPAADLLIINPQSPGTSEIEVSGVVTGTQNTAAIRLANSPLLQFVDWSGVNIRQMAQIDAPWAQTLVEADGGPLVLIGERNGHRVAILSFDLQQSDLPLQITFPILMANMTNWLRPGQAFNAPEGLKPGDVVTLVPNATTTAVQVVLPDGTTFAQEFADNEEILFTQTDQLGVYVVGLEDSTGVQVAGGFAINLFAPEESAITPAESIIVGATPLGDEQIDDVGQREFWIWLAAVAFIILLLEWWIYHRGARWPKIVSLEPFLNRWQNR